MMSFGVRLRVTVFGSSHGPEVGATVEGIPPGVRIEPAAIQELLDRRRPFGRSLSTRRREEDRLVIDAGIEGGRTTGGALRAHVANTDVARGPYRTLRDTPRPGHADYPARIRFGDSADLSGGGIFSGRMTVGLVIAGGVGRAMLGPQGIDIAAFCRSIGEVEAPGADDLPIAEIRRRAAQNEIGTLEPDIARRMAEAIGAARRSGDSVGGIVEVAADGCPVGLGEPFFDSVEGVLAHLAFAVPGVKAIEFGDGLRSARVRGSENNDPMRWDDGRVRSVTNHSGGALGGLTNGARLAFRVAVKATPSIARRQQTVNLRTRKDAEIIVTGRHDPCIVPRAVVVLESVTWFALADLAMRAGFVGSEQSP
jgi:chorismate synthase